MVEFVRKHSMEVGKTCLCGHIILVDGEPYICGSPCFGTIALIGLEEGDRFDDEKYSIMDTPESFMKQLRENDPDQEFTFEYIGKCDIQVFQK